MAEGGPVERSEKRVETLVDSSVILDVLTEDPVWESWSSDILAELAEASTLVINPIIYSEVSLTFDRIEDLETILDKDLFRRDPLPWEAAYLAGKCFLEYRKREGGRRSRMPDFYIGAHASLKGMQLVTRCAARYRTYFPKVKLISPD